MKVEGVRAAICSYINEDAAKNSSLRVTLELLVSRLSDVVIFGGMLRDFAWGKSNIFDSDIDLVANTTRGEIYAAIKHFSPRINRFGGFSFSYGGNYFDLWALEDTWALREGLVKKSGFDALLDTTFFGVDAAYFNLKTKEYRFSPLHERGISKKILELNLKANPSPRCMVERAIAMAIKNKLVIGNDLVQYIIEHWDNFGSDAVEERLIKALHCHLERGSKEMFGFYENQIDDIFPEQEYALM